MRKNHPLSDVFPEMTPDEFALLKRDIAEKGILQPILISHDGRIIDGRHRYRAGCELGLDDSDFDFEVLDEELTDKDIVGTVLALNLHRRHLTPSQRAMVAARVRPMFEDVLGNKATQREVSEAAAKALAVGQDLVVQARKLQEQSNASQALLDAVDRGQVAIRDALQAANTPDAVQSRALQMYEKGTARTLRQAVLRINRDARIQEAEKTPPPSGTYQVLVVDPPWKYSKRADDPTQRGKAPYATLSQEQLLRFTLPAAKDCILWLWTTNAHMSDAYELLKAWEFTPRTILTWAKPKIGLGDWLRGQTEHCILAVKGSPITRPPGSHSTLLSAPVGAHSEKPEAFFAMVDALCPGTKAELFARRRRDGWTCFGAELPKEGAA